jgi:phytoene dehydrogenase-like protein
MDFDAIVVGSGPNGLAAAIELARAGCSVAVFEARDTVGGGARSAELTLPGFTHDICSAVHPLAVGSPFFKTLPLNTLGVEWIQPDFPVAHPLDNGGASILYRDVEQTAFALGADSRRYFALFSELTAHCDELLEEVLAPIHAPRHPLLLASFGRHAIRPATSFARSQFTGQAARALFAGLAGHALLPLEYRPAAAFGILLAILGHAVGWPIPKGGSQQISNALATHLRSLGGCIFTGRRIEKLDELPSARVILCDITPRQLLHIAGDRLSPAYSRKLRQYRYGPGVFKLDWALNAPIPWAALDCKRAGTLHLGGTLEEIAAAEAAVGRGQIPDKPFVLLSQQSVFDSSRAPNGRHTAWAYCHVPNGSTIDMTSRIESQIERFAPGFRDCILQRHTINTAQFEDYNPNNVGGDINGGMQDLWQILQRPASIFHPYRTSIPGVYLCSSSTPPGGGVHGMCGYHAARAALRDMNRK